MCFLSVDYHFGTEGVLFMAFCGVRGKRETILFSTKSGCPLRLLLIMCIPRFFGGLNMGEIRKL